jgi:hypothetical protein
MRLLVALAAVAAGWAADAPVVFRGMCDASAAVFADGQVMVANDEDGAPLFRLYDPARGGLPVRIATLNAAPLALSTKKPEMDLEGAAVLGDHLYLTGSHGRSRTGKVRESRRRLIAIEWPIRSHAAVLSGRPYTTLLDDLAARLRADSDPAFRRLTLDPDLPPRDGGLNIEGLAATPSGGLLFGFRSPLVGGKAMAAVLQNPDRVLRGARPDFGPIALLDLAGDGVRDLVWDPRRSAYLVLSGPVGGGDGFGLYRWSGRAGDRPVLLRRSTAGRLGVEGGAPEALAFSAPGALWMFFDEGRRRVGGQSCKESAARSFRGLVLVP